MSWYCLQGLCCFTPSGAAIALASRQVLDIISVGIVFARSSLWEAISVGRGSGWREAPLWGEGVGGVRLVCGLGAPLWVGGVDGEARLWVGAWVA